MIVQIYESSGSVESIHRNYTHTFVKDVVMGGLKVL